MQVGKAAVVARVLQDSVTVEGSRKLVRGDKMGVKLPDSVCTTRVARLSVILAESSGCMVAGAFTDQRISV